jgi:5-methylcytosine-specific restriction endonuclease McrA
MKKLYFSVKEPSVEMLLAWKTKGKLITNPDYQRDYVYTEDKASRLIESALMLIPLPTIYLCEEENGSYSVIDGQQRIMSFIKFVSGEFALKGLTTLLELNGKYYKDLDDDSQKIIDDTTFRTIVIGKESADAKYDIFERLNRGAVTLKEQELRNCVYRGPYNTMINEIANSNKNVALLFKAKNNRMWYQEYILRFFALRDFMIYKPSMKSHLNNYMKNNQFNEDGAKADKDQFVRTLSLVKEVLGEDAFATVDYDKKITMNKFSATFYDSIMVSFSFFDKIKLINKADAVRNAIEDKKLHDDSYHDACYAATGSRDRVIKRILIIYNLINSILGDNAMKGEERTFDSSLKLPLAEKQNYICPLCGNKIVSIDECEIDHIVPFSLGGKTTFENAQLVHKLCNRHKSNNVDIDKALESVGSNNIYRMSQELDIRGKKITMYEFLGQTHLVDKWFEFFAMLMNDIKNAVPGKFKELADQEFKLTNRSRPYISHSKDGMYNPYEVEPGVFVECCMDNNRLMWFGRAIFAEFNLNPDNVVITLKGSEDDSDEIE